MLGLAWNEGFVVSFFLLHSRDTLDRWKGVCKGALHKGLSCLETEKTCQ